MCPDTENLLSLIDEAAPEEVTEHVSQCATCQREVSALMAQRAMLRALPEVSAPPMAATLLSKQRLSWSRPVAVAAALALVGVMAMWMAGSPESPAQEMVVELDVPVGASPGTAQAEEIQSLVQRSAQLERQWQFLNRYAPRVRRVAHEATTAPLKTGLMQLDARYAELPEPKYWQQRVQLLDTLVTLENTERLVRDDARLGLRPALLRTL